MRQQYFASVFTVDENAGRLLFIYHSKQKKWFLPRSRVPMHDYPCEVVRQDILKETGYEILFSKVPSPIALETYRNKGKNVIDFQYVATVVGGIPIFHEQKFAWFNISEMVERNIDVSIIQRARMLGCY